MSGSSTGEGLPRGALLLETRLGRYVVDVEIAATDAARATGLMSRTSVPRGTGLLLAYPDARERWMWMRNVLVALDIVFVGADERVRRIERSAAPGSDRMIPSLGPVKWVLEMAGGEAQRIGLETGDAVACRGVVVKHGAMPDPTGVRSEETGQPAPPMVIQGL